MATYPVTLPASATNVSVQCLNLPVGAGCSYSAENSSVVITTAAGTPPATYEITLVFTETLPGAATALVLLPILLAPLRLRKRRKGGCAWILLLMGLVIAAVGTAGGCGGGQSTQTTSSRNPSAANPSGDEFGNCHPDRQIAEARTSCGR